MSLRKIFSVAGALCLAVFVILLLSLPVLAAPTLTIQDFSSNNADLSFAKVNDTVTLTFTASEGLQTPVVTIAGRAATVFQAGNAASWIATQQMLATDTEGNIAFSVSYVDLLGNAGPIVTDADYGNTVVFDKTPPADPLFNPLNNTTIDYTNVTLTATYAESVVVTGSTLTGPSGTTNISMTTDDTLLYTYSTPNLAAGDYVLSITAEDWAANSTQSLVSFTAGPNLIVTTASLPAGTVGVAYSQTLAASGGSGGNTWAVTVGTLPAGLTLNTANGVISGTPTTVGTSNFTIGVTDSLALTASQPLSITIYAVLQVTTASLPAGTVGTAYSQTLAAAGGSGGNTWAVTAGALPAGLTLNAANGIISGTPTTAAVYNFTVRATDSLASTASQALSITINAAPVSLSVLTLSLPASTVGASYSQTVVASGGSGGYTWAVTVGALPAGLTLNAATGVISGTPNTAGTYNFTLQVTDSSLATATGAFSIVITDATLPTLTIQDFSSNNADLSFAKVNDTVTLTFTASEDLQTPLVTIAGRAATVFQAGNLMSWLATQEMLATDTEGIIAFNVSYLDLAGNAGTNVTNANYANSVVFDKTPPAAPVFNPLNHATIDYTNVTLTATYAESVIVTNNTLTDLAGTTNIVMTTADNLLYTYSTPNLAAGDYVLSITVEDWAGNSTQALVNFTAGPNLIVTTASLPAGTVGVAYSQTLAASGGSGGNTWAVTVGTLPAGLTLNTANGVISGTPTTVGTSNFTVEVTDSLALTASQALSITINAVLQVTTASLPAGTFGVVYSQTLVAAGGSGGNTWAVTAGVLPSGLTLNTANGNISGTPTAAGTFNFTVRVTDSLASTASRALSITINPILQVTTASLPAGMVGTAYSQTLLASGGSGGNTWAITAGAFPPGLTFNTSSGLISGTPTTVGTYNFTARVTESLGSTASQALSITIYPVLQVTTVSLPAGTVGTAYSQTLVAAGGSGGYTWAVTAGALPAGLTLNTANGVISGTPTTAAVYNFTVRATDSLGSTASQALSITVYAVLQVTTASLPAGTVGTAYSQTLAAAGGSGGYTWAVTAGVLPSGLALNAANGVISGTPTTVGTYNFTVRVTDSVASTATRALSITINAAPVTLTVLTLSLPANTVGASYSQTVVAAGGSGSYTWAVTVGALPAGLTLNAATGVISGTPTTVGTYNFTLRVTDSLTATASQAFSITIYPVLLVTTASLPAGTVGVAYSQTLAATGGSGGYTWAVTLGTLPAGLTLNTANGVISGTPTTAAVYNFTVRATDSLGFTASQALSITIHAVLQVTTASLPAGTVGVAYSQTPAAAGGSGGYTWAVTVGSLPAGLALNAANGNISGTPTTLGTSSFTVRVTDSLALTATRALSITINAAPVSLTVLTLSLSPGTVGASYNQTVVAAGGTAGYTWAVTAGALPAGLTLIAANGNISGTPTTAGSYNFTVRVTDSLAGTASQPLSITIYPVLLVTTASLPAGTVGTAYSQTLVFTGGSGVNTWAITAGALPAGLTLNTANGNIYGTPNTAASYNFTIGATDSLGAVASKAFSITINAVFQVTTGSLPAGTVGVAYSQTLAAAGGSGGYTWAVTVGALPAGLTLNTATGVISGTPTTAASYNFTVQVTDSLASTANQVLSITITDTPVYTGGGGGGTSTPTPTPTPTPVSTPINATGGTLSWVPNASGMTPSNMTLTSVDGKTLVSIPQSTLAEDKQGQPLSSITCVLLSSSIPAPPSKMIIASYEIGPSGATFDPAIRITMSYDPALIPAGANAADLVLAFYDVSTSTWITLDNIVVDTQNHTVSGTTTHFTQFSLILPRVVAPVTTPVPTTQPAPTTTTAQPSPTITPTKTTTPAVSSPVKPTPTKPSNTGKTGIIIIASIIVVCVVLGVFLILRKRRDSFH